MSSRLVKLIVPVAFLLSAPCALFVSANLIEELAGSGGSGVFGSTFDSWKNTINGLIFFGPLVALGLLALTSARLHRERTVRGFAATLELKMPRPVMWVALVVASVWVSLVAYGVAETYGEWRDFHNMNWTCTTDGQGRQVCYQGILTPEEIPGSHP